MIGELLDLELLTILWWVNRLMAQIAKSIALECPLLSWAARTVSTPYSKLHSIFTFDYLYILSDPTTSSTSSRHLTCGQLPFSNLLSILEAFMKVVILPEWVISLMRVFIDHEHVIKWHLHLSNHQAVAKWMLMLPCEPSSGHTHLLKFVLWRAILLFRRLISNVDLSERGGRARLWSLAFFILDLPVPGK